MREKLPGEYHRALDTMVRFAFLSSSMSNPCNQAMLQPENLHRAVSDLATMYHQTFGLDLPPVSHEVLLYRYMTQLALPLDVFPAVQGLAQMTRSDFRYSTKKETRRKQSSAYPELQLMSLLIIAVKLLYPFDGVQGRPRSIHEPTTHQMDWMSWNRHQQGSSMRLPGTSLARRSEISVRDTDVFKMNQQELDSYMNWYQKTWVREPRSGSDDSVSKEILDMFPLYSLDQPGEQTPRRREEDLEEAFNQRAQTTTLSMKFQRPITDEEASDQELHVKRPGEGYRLYKQEEELPDAAKAFFEAAAKTACTSVKNLMLAVLQKEAQVTLWKRAKRRAEITGQDIDLDAEMRRAPGEKPETQVAQEVETMTIREEPMESDESDSDTDMRPIS